MIEGVYLMTPLPVFTGGNAFLKNIAQLLGWWGGGGWVARVGEYVP